MNPEQAWTDPEDDEAPPVSGLVPTTGRGSLPFAAVHGEPLVVVASWALDRAGVTLVDFTASWQQVQGTGRPLVIHDPLCPLTPVAFLQQAIAVSAASDEVVVGVRPVTDTVKTLRTGGVLGDTVDRERLWTVTSPVVLPASVVAALDEWPDVDDPAALVTALRDRFEVRFLAAPATGARVQDESAIALLEALAAS